MLITLTIRSVNCIDLATALSKSLEATYITDLIDCTVAGNPGYGNAGNSYFVYSFPGEEAVVYTATQTVAAITALSAATSVSGTTNSTFGIDEDATTYFKIKNSSGVCQLRNQGDTDFAQLYCAKIYPSGAIDFSTVVTGTGTAGTILTTGTTWVDHATAGQCGIKLLLSNSATTGDFATLRLRARSDAAGATVCGNFSASAGVDGHGNLYAVQGYAQPNAYTQADPANIVCGLYSCIDATAASVGRRWSLWTDEHSNTKASGGHYLHRLSNNSTNSTQYDGIWTIYSGAGCSYLMNFEGTNPPLYSGDKTGNTPALCLAVYADGAIRYIQLYDAA